MKCLPETVMVEMEAAVPFGIVALNSYFPLSSGLVWSIVSVTVPSG